MRLVPNVYIAGADALGIVNASNTVRNFPKPPTGERIAEIKPPRFSPSSNPADQAGTAGEDAANAAPMKCGMICLSVSFDNWRIKNHALTLALKKAEYV